jgi:hypothetical protein
MWAHTTPNSQERSYVFHQPRESEQPDDPSRKVFSEEAPAETASPMHACLPQPASPVLQQNEWNSSREYADIETKPHVSMDPKSRKEASKDDAAEVSKKNKKLAKSLFYRRGGNLMEKG